MQLRVGRSMTMLAMVMRSVSGFVGPIRVTAARSAGGALRIHSGSTAAARPKVSVFDAQAAELTAERLWGMADARKPEKSPVLSESQAEAKESKLPRDSGSMSATGAFAEGERDDFIQGEWETSALRRYHYTDQVLADDDSGNDDGKVYYI